MRRYRGVVALESAFVLPITFFLLFAMLDLGLAAVRFNALSEAARTVAREVVLHGSMALDSPDAWGPGQFQAAASSDSDIVRTAQNVLPTMRLEDVTVAVSWADNDNSPRDRVRVRLSYLHQPLIPVLFAWGPLELRAEAIMRIVN
ncbi:TadE/TadG family type IV pilus assembly protein [Botrimarina mediterranea]|uniref:TadE-like protein n=1 Tax=Botrimarina mediterranea TaxID=2528022 RepID=A0A518KCT8_9BACT|nr:TadE family protein [Botrimarina mediterranea]QDV75604.1 TadE-like protein [Botrimarina mediterranea]QDV80238.1 TadE-like protein [Planctomycetes bacterium K2D]